MDYAIITTTQTNISITKGNPITISPKIYDNDNNVIDLSDYTLKLIVAKDIYFSNCIATYIAQNNEFVIGAGDIAQWQNLSYYYKIYLYNNETAQIAPIKGIMTLTTPYGNFLLNLFPDSYPITGEIFSTLFQAIGYALDQVDPYKIAVPEEFSISTASGDYLDICGADWGVSRRDGEDDDAYRARVLAMLPIYANGASIAGLSYVVKNFIGTAPTIYDLCADGFSWGDSAWGDNAWSDLSGLFTIIIYVNNPDNVSYSHYDMEYSLKQGKPARSRIILHHNGIDTSPLNELSTEIVILV